MKYFKFKDRVNELKSFADKGLTGLLSTGLPVLDPFIMLKKGYPIFIAGNPGGGKTEFTFEILMNTSVLYDWKHFIYCGEGGNVEHIFYELIFKYLQKPYKNCTEKEKIQAEYFIDEHFVIANHDKDFTIDEFYKLVDDCENEFEIKFDCTVFDPFNDIKNELAQFGGREDNYLAHALKQVRISSKKNNRIDILVNHIADVKPMIDKDTGNRYMPPASANEWAGGRTWWRRAFTMILVYRPYVFMKDINGIPFEENESHIIIQKSKPKGVGKIGKASIFWDWKKNRYYCKMPNGQELYSCETIDSLSPPKMQPNTDFTIGQNQLNDEGEVK